MTTKPHSNEEVREELKKHCWVDERDDHQMPLDEVVALLAQKDKAVSDARREERERIITIVKENTMAFMFPSTQERFIKTITPPDQTANPTN